MAPYCPGCGEKVESYQNYCEYCGSVLGGYFPQINEILCPVCRGKGEIAMNIESVGLPPFKRICIECGGAGTIFAGSAK